MTTDTQPMATQREFGQFLSDVMTAAGPVTHGKQCKALGDRLADMCVRLRRWGQPARSGEPVHTNTEKTIERYLTIFKDHTTGQYYAAPFLHEELIKSSKYARDMSEYQINKTCVAQLKLAFVEGQFEDI